jgi:hypothetical protein
VASCLPYPQKRILEGRARTDATTCADEVLLGRSYRLLTL